MGDQYDVFLITFRDHATNVDTPSLKVVPHTDVPPEDRGMELRHLFSGPGHQVIAMEWVMTGTLMEATTYVQGNS